MRLTRSLATMAFALLSTAAMAQQWSFTDGAGNTITLDEPPERIVAFSSSAAGLLQFGIRPIAIFSDGTGSDKSFAGFDLEGIELIRTGWNEMQPETLLALDPDLIVTEYFPMTRSYSGGEQMDPDKEFGRVAPIVGVEQGASALQVIEDYGVLAEALGADLMTPQMVDQRARFEAAREAFSAAIAAKPDLTAMAVNPLTDALLVAVPAGAGELQDFINWGLDIVVPEAEPNAYWGELSAENVNRYEADLLLVDDRAADTRDRLDAMPTRDLLPAYVAGQVGDWPAWWIRTYDSYAAELEKLTALIEGAEVLVAN